MGAQASREYEVKSGLVRIVILLLPLKINSSWSGCVECQLVSGDPASGVTGVLGNLASFPRVFEVPSGTLMLEMMKNHTNEKIVPLDMTWYKWPPEPLGLFCQAGSDTAHSQFSTRIGGRKLKYVHTYNFQVMVSRYRSQEADALLPVEQREWSFVTKRGQDENQGRWN